MSSTFNSGLVEQRNVPAVLENHMRRIRILEAAAGGGGSLTVTDGLGTGGVTVAPTTELDIGCGLALTNPGTDIARIDLSNYTQFIPTVKSIGGSDPVFGSLPSGPDGWYVALNGLVHYVGICSWSSIGISLGTNPFQIEYPIPPSLSMIQGIARMTGGISNPGQAFDFYAEDSGKGWGGGSTGFVLTYIDTPPMGNLKAFQSTSGWTLGTGDSFAWNIVYRSAGCGAGSGGGGPGLAASWALAQSNSTNVAGNATPTPVYFDLANFLTNDTSVFAQSSAAGTNGISILQPGLYRVWFDIDLSKGSDSSGATEKAKLYVAGDGIHTEAFWYPGEQDTYGVINLGSTNNSNWSLFKTALWNYATGETYPGTRITVGAAGNWSGNASGGGNVYIERVGNEVPGGF